MSAKHTPGPWIAKECANGEFEIMREEQTNPMLGLAWTAAPFQGLEREAIKANAALIAAAPDLLAALDGLCRAVSKYEKEWLEAKDEPQSLQAAFDAARDAIAAAEGGAQ